MNQTSYQLTDAPEWVWVSVSNVGSFWGSLPQMYTGCSPNAYASVVNRLRADKQLSNPDAGLLIELKAMSTSEKAQLDYLRGYEQAGFRLTSFRRENLAEYSRQSVIYRSMRQMIECGHVPLCSIAINRNNTALFATNGDLLDVFVPLSEVIVNFTKT